MTVADLDLPPQKKIRLTSGIDRYGFSSILAAKIGLPFVPRSFANWVHGWIWYGAVTPELLLLKGHPHDVSAIVRNEDEQRVLTEAGFKNVHIGGLPYAYVPKQHRPRYDDRLLAIPTHSAESEKLTTDQKHYLDYLESLVPDYEGIYLSIYYLDLNGPMHKAAENRRLKTILGARPDDANSLLRTRAMFDSFKFVTSNTMGSHVLYSLFSDCFFSFCGPIYSYDESIFLSNGNPLGHSPTFVSKQLEMYSESYLRNNFGRYFKQHPRLGCPDKKYAEKEIGSSNILCSSSLREAVGWTVSKQTAGYSSGFLRRVRRSLLSL
jgi:hypothetical protein